MANGRDDHRFSWITVIQDIFYNAKGETITIEEGRKYTLKTVKELLELTYVDNPIISDDKIVIKFAPY